MSDTPNKQRRNDASRPLDRVLERLLLLRLFVPLTAVALLAVALSGYLMVRIQLTQLEALALSVAYQAEEHLDRAGRVMGAVAGVAEVSSDQDLLPYMEATWRAYGYFDTLYRLDPDGTVRLLVPPDSRYEGIDLSRQPIFQEQLGQATHLVSRPFISLRTGQPTVYLSHPLSDRRLVVGELSLGVLQAAITAGPEGSPGSSIWLADQNGTLLAHPDVVLVAQQANVGDLEILRRGQAGEAAMVFNSGQGYRLGTTAHITPTGWIVVAQTPMSTIFSPLAGLLGLALLSSVVVWLALVWNLRRQMRQQVVAPLAQLGESVYALTASDYAQGTALTRTPHSFAELAALAADVEQMSVAIRAREERLSHLNAVLRAIRNVNQLIVHERDRDRLLKLVCQNLIETRGYPHAWIGLLDDVGGLAITAKAGQEEGFQQLVAQVQGGDLPLCARQALLQDKAVVIVNDHHDKCTGCPLSGTYQGQAGLATRLEQDGRVFGVMSVAVPASLAIDEEECQLFQEVAGDVAYALRGLELEAERQRAEEALRQSEEKFRTLVNQAADMLLFHDMEGNILDVNQASIDQYGYSKEELLSMRVSDLDPDYVAREDHGQFWEQFEIGEPFRFEARQERRDGTIFPVEVTLTKVMLQGETYVMGLCRDITERVRAEDALRESENRLIEAQRMAKMGDFTWDVETGEVTWSDALFDLLRYDKSEGIDFAKINAQIHHPDDLERVTRWLNDCVTFGHAELTPNEYRVIRRDGEILYVRTVGVIERGEGKSTRVFATIQDITERVRIEEEIRSLARFPDENSNPVLRVARDGMILYANRSSEPLLSLWETQLGHHVPDRWRQMVVDVLDADHSRIVEVECEQIIYALTLTPIERTDYVNIYASDITSRMRAEEALRALSTRQEAILASVPDIIMEVDVDKVYTWANKAGLEFFGSDVLGKEADYFFEGEQETYSWVQPLFDGQDDVIYVESWQRRFDGEKRLLAWWCQVVKDAQGQVTGALSTARDITERNRAEEELQRHREQLEDLVTQRTEELRHANEELALRGLELQAKNRELETFTYSVSHDLKAPLRGIDGYSRLLLEDYAGQLDEEGQTFLHTIRQATNQMRQLIDDLLAYSRLERRAQALELVDVDALVEALVAEREDEIKQQGIELVAALSCNPIEVEAESLIQALRNLLDNAIKFSRNVPRPRIEIGGRETEQGCTLWVRDNGIGFDMRYHDRIFGIFQRLHRAEEYPGTGIGLAIVHKAMKRMSGRAWAESAPGEGAAFYLEIPRSA